jgi:hypothetical protein
MKRKFFQSFRLYANDAASPNFPYLIKQLNDQSGVQIFCNLLSLLVFSDTVACNNSFTISRSTCFTFRPAEMKILSLQLKYCPKTRDRINSFPAVCLSLNPSLANILCITSSIMLAWCCDQKMGNHWKHVLQSKSRVEPSDRVVARILIMEKWNHT